MTVLLRRCGLLSVLLLGGCSLCHGAMAISAGVLPDLRWSAVSADPETWRAMVLDGILAGNGMAPFPHQLSAQDAESVRAYVIDQAWLAVRNGDAKAPATKGSGL